MIYSKGIMWLDDTRIPFKDEGDIKSQERAFSPNSSSHRGQLFNNDIFNNNNKGGRGANETNKQGRFTPNLLVSDDALNDGNVSEAGKYKGEGSKSGGIWNKSTGKPAGKEYGDKGSNSRYYDIDLWFNNLIYEIL